MRFSIRHAALFSFNEPRSLGVQALRLTPHNSPRQRILSWSLSLPAQALERKDAYGNLTHLLSLEQPHREILLEVEGLVETLDVPEAAEEFLSPLVFLRPSEWTQMDEPLQSFVEQFRPVIERNLRHGLELLMHQLHQQLVLRPSIPVATAVAAFRAGRGSRMALAHVLLACCRYLKIPARFVSGYRYRPEQNATPHCWVEIWLGQNWQTYDPCKVDLTGVGYLKLAVGLDYLDTCPVRFAQQVETTLAEQLDMQLLTTR